MEKTEDIARVEETKDCGGQCQEINNDATFRVDKTENAKQNSCDCKDTDCDK